MGTPLRRSERVFMRATLTRAGLATASGDLGVAALFLAFAYANLRAFLAHPRLSPLLIVVLETAFAAFALVRRRSTSTATTPLAWISTAAGTFLPLLLRPTGATEDSLAAQVVQILGLILGIASVLSLNRSIGLLPAHRGIRSSGTYRWVRHPLYASYLIAQAGYVASNPSAWNVSLLVIVACAQLVRIAGEERLLSSDPAYLEYVARTRWKLVPFLF